MCHNRTCTLVELNILAPLNCTLQLAVTSRHSARFEACGLILWFQLKSPNQCLSVPRLSFGTIWNVNNQKECTRHIVECCPHRPGQAKINNFSTDRSTSTGCSPALYFLLAHCVKASQSLEQHPKEAALYHREFVMVRTPLLAQQHEGTAQQPGPGYLVTRRPKIVIRDSHLWQLVGNDLPVLVERRQEVLVQAEDGL